MSILCLPAWSVTKTGIERHYYGHRPSLLLAWGITITGIERHYKWHGPSLLPAWDITIGPAPGITIK